MKLELLLEQIKKLGIQTITGIPDSTLWPLCNYLNGTNHEWKHFVPANEGAAVGIAMGSYLASGKPACVYMQNSGIGNALNPMTSLLNEAVYEIPMFFIVGWRGEPGKKDEPQHQFMGKITREVLNTIQIEHDVITAETTETELEEMFQRADTALKNNRQYAIVVTRNAFESQNHMNYQNKYFLQREEVISEILKHTEEQDIIVSTTGKISREVYEQSEKIRGHHNQAFLTVGGMGHAGMIAFGIASERKNRNVYCIEGDGAILMHMGEMAFIAQQQPENYIHICINNNAHESVGGMPTGASGKEYSTIARACGYQYISCVEDMDSLKRELTYIREKKGPVFLEIKVKMESRSNLGRPKESAKENKKAFMEYHFSEGRVKLEER